MDHSNEFDNYTDLLLTQHALDVIMHPNQKWDTIVIGSGMGGMTCAGALAKGAGERVLLLEKHTKLGGCTHEFRNNSIDFDTGVHYIGGNIWDQKSTLRKVTDSITDGKLLFARMDDVYDVAVINGEQFKMRSGMAKQKSDLKQRFPDFKPQLDAYFAELDKEGARFSAYMKRQVAKAYVPSVLVLKDQTFGQETVSQALDRLKITDQTLRGVLTYLYGDYGAKPEEASWAEHCVVAAHYCNGAAYPVGGSGKIGRAVLAVIESRGGRAATRAPVQSILVENGVAVGVVMKGGHVVRANKVISCVGAFHTFVNLLPKDLETTYPSLAKARKDLEGDLLKMSPSHSMTFLALKGTAQSLGLPKANWWILDEPRFESVFISFPSAKDPTWESRFPDTSVCEIVVEAPYEMFEKWKSDPVKNRSPEYVKFKDELADQMCEILFKHFPQLKDKVDFRDASTPLSAEHFLGSKKGCAYGLACTPPRYTAEWLKPATDIKNLYLGAQDIVSCGIAGSMMGGILSACAASFKTLWHYYYLFSLDRPATESEDLWETMDEVDSGGVAF